MKVNKIKRRFAQLTLMGVTVLMGSTLLGQNSFDVNHQTPESNTLSGFEAAEKFLKLREEIKNLRHQATEENDVNAQWELGRRHITGDGIPQNLTEGARWVRIAAAQGHVRAQGALGSLYSRGFGVSKDTVEAARWYRLAAEQGNVYGQISLGMLYERGEGVLKDEDEARKWYGLAAKQGDSMAQMFLGTIYIKDRKNSVLGHMWLNIASANGNSIAGHLRDDHERLMTRGQIHQAIEIARTCKASNYQICEP